MFESAAVHPSMIHYWTEGTSDENYLPTSRTAGTTAWWQPAWELTKHFRSHPNGDVKNSWVVLSNTASLRTLPPKLAYIETCIPKANNKLKADEWEKFAEEVQTGRIWVGAKDESWAIPSMEREKGEGMSVIALREKVTQEGPYIGRKES